MSKPVPRDRVNFSHPRGKFAFLTEAYIREHYLQLTPHQSRDLRAALPRGIYWLQTVKGGLIHWNWSLLQSYLLDGCTSTPSHRELVEEYVSTLPQSA
jgi:hypothetical protein